RGSSAVGVRQNPSACVFGKSTTPSANTQAKVPAREKAELGPGRAPLGEFTWVPLRAKGEPRPDPPTHRPPPARQPQEPGAQHYSPELDQPVPRTRWLTCARRAYLRRLLERIERHRYPGRRRHRDRRRANPSVDCPRA